MIVKTPAGFGRLKRQETTLDEKMTAIDQTLQKHHLREGLVGEIYLKEPGKLDAGSRHLDDLALVGKAAALHQVNVGAHFGSFIPESNQS